MNESRHDKAWNDPPLFSLDQMSRDSNSVPTNRRHRYPQQTNNGSANQQFINSNLETNPPFMSPNIQYNNQNDNNQEVFDLNNFIISVNTMIGSIYNAPQDLVLKWHNIQNNLYNIQFENQTQINFISLMRAIQSNDFNNARVYSGYLTHDNTEMVRTTALILNELLRYIA